MKTHNPQYARSEYHTQLAKMSFDKIFDLTAGVYFNFYNIIKTVTTRREKSNKLKSIGKTFKYNNEEHRLHIK